jgi:peptide deformylase
MTGKSYDRKLSLRIFPDEVLRRNCEPVEKFTTELRDVIDDMFILMRRLNGIGLAAPQVGISERFFVCGFEDQSISLVNPVIITSDKETSMTEGCLSLPNIEVDILRKERIFVHGYDIRGNVIRVEMTGLWSRVAQHEIDHLNGVLISDYGADRHPGRDSANE